MLNCPLFKVEIPPPHNLDMAYGPETGNNILVYDIKVQYKLEFAKKRIKVTREQTVMVPIKLLGL